ncbi:MAG: hypothetical protein GY869_25725, partial [Planctomycetes bacterium]|nr:hypothetical protein [Planctomycetota bacterium]
EDYYLILPIPEYDLGDAPSPYPTLRIDNGPSHRIDMDPNIYLGALVDFEFDGQPDPAALGDDNTDADDEDGVVFTTPITPGMISTVEVTASVTGHLDGWIDLNKDGNWDDPCELIFDSLLLNPGLNVLNFQVTDKYFKSQFVADTDTFARFRFSKNGGLSYVGPAPDGEVEDYHVYIDWPMDYGDAPSPYPTRFSDNGARHKINPGFDIRMGLLIDSDHDGVPDINALGDDNLNLDDEDGVSLPAALNPGAAQTISVTVNVDGFLNAWIDFNDDGDWLDADEQIFIDQPVIVGNNDLNVDVPEDALPVTDTYARFRFNTAGGLNFFGLAPDGEVEDVPVFIGEPVDIADLGDAPDSTNNVTATMSAYPAITANYPTVYQPTSPPVGPLHIQPTAVAHLGPLVSLEQNADIKYDQDPNNNLIPLRDLPNLDAADDGISNLPHLPHCQWTTFEYLVNVLPGGDDSDLYVNVWFDWNRDGDWDDIANCTSGPAPEWAVQNQLLINLTPGSNLMTSPAFLCWHPIDGPGNIWMRITLSESPCRFGKEPAAGFGGAGPTSGYQYGETEDYYYLPDTSCLRIADLNCDRWVNLLDFAIFSSKWLTIY